MARSKDESKRDVIINTSMNLFSRQGFHKTSIPDIVSESGLSTGTIYTYFSSKDEIMHSIIVEGWEQFSAQLAAKAAALPDSESKIRVLLDEFLNLLLENTDLVNILISEALHSDDAAAILENVISLVTTAIGISIEDALPTFKMSADAFRAGVVIFLMGIIDTVRLAKAGTISVSYDEINEFVSSLIKNSGFLGA